MTTAASPGPFPFRFARDVMTFSAGARVFAQDEPGDVMYAVVEGEVSLLVGGRVVETVAAGGILGEMALIDGEPRSATAVARTDCRLARIDADHFDFLVRQTPRFALQVMRELARRLRRMNR